LPRPDAGTRRRHRLLGVHQFLAHARELDAQARTLSKQAKALRRAAKLVGSKRPTAGLTAEELDGYFWLEQGTS
jgi:hypothetical protein